MSSKYCCNINLFSDSAICDMEPGSHIFTAVASLKEVNTEIIYPFFLRLLSIFCEGGFSQIHFSSVCRTMRLGVSFLTNRVNLTKKMCE